MTRYIDADKFAERIKLSPAFKNMAFEGDLLQRVVLDLLGNAPTADVVEVVRCKDCRYRDEMCMCSHPKQEGILPLTYPLDFCSYGKRRDA